MTTPASMVHVERLVGTDADVEAPHQVTAVVPVKALAVAKTRLELPAHERQALALAFALDTITALCASPLVVGVLVVTNDPLVVRRVLRLGVRLAVDDGAGLDSAVRGGMRDANSWCPGDGVAVVPSDLPCLHVDDVAQVLSDRRSAEGAFVPDRSGTGTTLVVHPPGRVAVTSYGPDSAARHSLLGLHRLDDAPVRARQDVDTVEDLRAARALGPGPETLAVLDKCIGWAEW